MGLMKKLMISLWDPSLGPDEKVDGFFFSIGNEQSRQTAMSRPCVSTIDVVYTQTSVLHTMHDDLMAPESQPKERLAN